MTAPDSTEPRPPRRPLPLSRRIALAIYGAALVFVAVSGFRSVIPQVFWPAHRAQAPADCSGEARALERELLDHAADHVRRGGEAPSATPPEWLGPWDARFEALRARCPDRAPQALLRLRYRIERTLWRFDRNEAERVAELRARLDRQETRETPPDDHD